MQSLLIIPKTAECVPSFLNLIAEVLSGKDSYKCRYDDFTQTFEIICEDNDANFIFHRATKEIPDLLLFQNDVHTLN